MLIVRKTGYLKIALLAFGEMSFRWNQIGHSALQIHWTTKKTVHELILFYFFYTSIFSKYIFYSLL